MIMREPFKTIGQLVLFVGGIGFLAACKAAPIETASAGADGRTVELIATAPDGTKLWRFEDGSKRTVYFASSGTQHDESCGKGCTRSVTVPTSTLFPEEVP